jgi:hypothetical protein
VLWHVGPYRYGWEDAGRDAERFGDHTFHITGAEKEKGNDSANSVSHPLCAGPRSWRKSLQSLLGSDSLSRWCGSRFGSHERPARLGTKGEQS